MHGFSHALTYNEFTLFLIYLKLINTQLLCVSRIYRMDNCTSEQWDDYLIDKEKRTEPLEEVRPPNVPDEIYLSVTLNVPRTLGFTRMSSHDQKKLYIKLFEHMMVCNRPIGWHTQTMHTFEFCKTGHVHLHAKIVYTPVGRYYIAGLIADLVKAYKRSVGRKTYYDDKCYYPEWDRYKDASICIQREQGSRKRLWDEYMFKCQ